MRTRSLRREAGSALVMTLVLGTVLGIGMMAYLTLIDNQDRAIRRAESWNYEIPVAEAGVEEALTQIWFNRYNLGTNGWGLTNNAYTKARVMVTNYAYYVVGISNVQPPVIYSDGYVRIPRSPQYLPPRTIRVTVGPNAFFKKGMVAKGTITMSGGVVVDSFDSADPAFSTGGRYDSAKAKDGGDIATVTGAAGAIDVGGGEVYGHASTGPGGSVVPGSGGAVGSRTWQNAGNTGVQPGWFTDDMNADFPDIPAPFTTGASPASGTFNGTNYTYLLGTGNYLMTSLSMSGQNKMGVSGTAVLYVTGNFSMAGQAMIYITVGGSLQLYVGGSVSLSGNGIMNYNAGTTNFALYGLPSNTSISMSGNAALTGTIYAPQAAFSLHGGGNNNYDFVGASVTASVSMNGHFNFHFDESLARNGPAMGVIVTSWREL
jgi:hypothetical protein